MIEMGLETQRGCVFKCGFCTFRTLTSPNVVSPDVAEDRIVATTAARHATIMLTDATATYQALFRSLSNPGDAAWQSTAAQEDAAHAAAQQAAQQQQQQPQPKPDKE